MRKPDLVKDEKLILLLLDSDFTPKLHRFDLIGDVIVVDGNPSLLMELDALHSDLVKLL